MSAVAGSVLEELKEFGCRRVLECTPNGLGRDPRLLKMLEDATGIEVWTPGGSAGVCEDRVQPDHASAGFARVTPHLVPISPHTVVVAHTE